MAALTVPGAIGGWKIALELSAALGGRLPLGDLLGRAIAQAREGVADLAFRGALAAARRRRPL